MSVSERVSPSARVLGLSPDVEKGAEDRLENFQDLCACLHWHALEAPGRTAVFCADDSMSFGTLDKTSTLLARWFLDQGLNPGDRVAVHSTNSIALVQIFFALFKAGLIIVTVNVRLKPPEIRYILDHSGARLLFSETALAPLAKEAGAHCAIISSLPAREELKASALPVLDP